MGKSVNKRIGILGGTFNPVHNGHLYLAKEACKRLRLDKVVFVPTYLPPHKKIKSNTKTSDRLEMLRLALEKNRRFAIYTYEIDEKGKSYSIRTIKSLRRKFKKNTELFFIIGADSLKGLKKWKDIRELKKIVKFAVFTRPGHIMKLASDDMLYFKVPGVNISSTKIRALLRKNRFLGSAIPRKVQKYIKSKKLYV